ncbi:fatty acid/sphingolipid desaturase [Auriscalpium vulgare]|uniref:Fatty acid/sphingolipid desaturase n=1 Tax=Auriscalpium vulgare TaxID=40419 RepID=A0ACB8S9G6_9AGAM|nr:fatty acid/sphingolipid desaturase [Auriscalpium vulgare]
METFTKERVKEKEFLIIDRKVYDAKEFAYGDHPGGTIILDYLGADATDTFQALHPDAAYETLANYYVGDLDPSVPDADAFTMDIRALNARLRKQGFYKGPIPFYIAMHFVTTAIWLLSIWSVYRFGDSLLGVLGSATVLGLFFQQAAWMSHDFVHRQVSDNNLVNYIGAIIWGELAQGLSRRWWSDKHGRHHSMTNIHAKDPDIESRPLIAWSEHTLELFAEVPDAELVDLAGKYLYVHQAIMYLPLLTFARILWNTESVIKEYQATAKTKWFNVACLAAYWGWVFALTKFIPSFPMRVLYVVFSVGMGGQFIAMISSTNHNGTLVLSKEEWEASGMGYYELQVRTSRDITSNWLADWFCGGLNQQITHHLFPRMPRIRFREVAPEVKRICEKHGVPFHSTGFVEAQLEIISRLNQIANTAKKMRSAQGKAAKAQ